MIFNPAMDENGGKHGYSDPVVALLQRTLEQYLIAKRTTAGKEVSPGDIKPITTFQRII
jgi:hypothetical protein